MKSNKRKQADYGLGSCERCGYSFTKRSALHKYCRDCSIQVDRERKSKWARENYDPSKKNKEVRTERTKKINMRGMTISQAEGRKGLEEWFQSIVSDNKKQTTVVVPFTYGFSKNHLWQMGQHGHVELRKEVNTLKENLSKEIRILSEGIAWVQDKVWLSIFVQKPDHRGDAVNIIDSVCDAVKKAIDVDDRWFCISRLDWQIVKVEPKLVVVISQDGVKHRKSCSTCGRILTLDYFSKNSYGSFGVARNCTDCVATSKPLQLDAESREIVQTRTEDEILQPNELTSYIRNRKPKPKSGQQLTLF